MIAQEPRIHRVDGKPRRDGPSRRHKEVGTNPRPATRAVMSTGLRRCSAARWMASSRGTPDASRIQPNSSVSNMPDYPVFHARNGKP